MNHLRRLASFPLFFALSLVACAQTKPAEPAATLRPHAEPLFEQCQSLDVRRPSTALVSDLSTVKSAEVKARIEAVERLAQSCDRRAVVPLVEVMKFDKEATARAAAVRALGRLGDRDSVDALLGAIDDSPWQVRLELGRALCSFQVHRASYDVLNRLASPANKKIDGIEDLYVRCQAILAVNQLRDVNFSRKAVSFLQTMSEDSELQSPAEREMVLEATRELKNTRNGPHEFVGILKQNLNPVYRIWAAEWIGRLGIRSGEEPLTEAAANDRDLRVRGAAAKALAQLKQSTGQ